ncbi:4320_t:CDS:2 [Acaulospora colombiana]|uniref:4320_t:CDS:1 n=1 Tax=Acaulospora colombiana TaxID=27376 RepID=A0ACA9L330_9GLOM|nr:4320_t:CDS:2 [Acaulospora colombiana]
MAPFVTSERHPQSIFESSQDSSSDYFSRSWLEWTSVIPKPQLPKPPADTAKLLKPLKLQQYIVNNHGWWPAFGGKQKLKRKRGNPTTSLVVPQKHIPLSLVPSEFSKRRKIHNCSHFSSQFSCKNYLAVDWDPEENEFRTAFPPRTTTSALPQENFAAVTSRVLLVRRLKAKQGNALKGDAASRFRKNVLLRVAQADGFGAAYSAWKRLGNNATYYPAIHGTPPPNDLKDKNVGIFDFAYPRSILTELEKQSKSLAIVDHHKSARNELLGDHSTHSENSKNYFFDMDKSGARLAWEFFWPDKEVPLLIRYIEDRDLWRFSLPKSREFSIFWSSIPYEFEAYDQYVKDESLIEKAIESGSQILNYVDSRISSMKTREAFERKMTVTTVDSSNQPITKTYNVNVINSSLWQSDLGHALVKKEGVDFSLIFFYDGKLKRYGVSLRSLDEKTDVSLIAKALGGGGHRNAAGFVWERESIESLFDPE